MRETRAGGNRHFPRRSASRFSCYLAGAALVAVVSFASAQASAAEAIFAGGCFWCVESDFEHVDGVTEAISGFTGGSLENPTYNGNHEGHVEAVKVLYDPSLVSYEQLLERFWTSIDPFDSGGQFCDRGHSYTTAIFVANEQERTQAEASKRAVQLRFPDNPVVTPILSAGTFYPIAGEESYRELPADKSAGF